MKRWFLILVVTRNVVPAALRVCFQSSKFKVSWKSQKAQQKNKQLKGHTDTCETVISLNMSETLVFLKHQHHKDQSFQSSKVHESPTWGTKNKNKTKTNTIDNQNFFPELVHKKDVHVHKERKQLICRVEVEANFSMVCT